jgi:hypothetical protein
VTAAGISKMCILSVHVLLKKSKDIHIHSDVKLFATSPLSSFSICTPEIKQFTPSAERLSALVLIHIS